MVVIDVPRENLPRVVQAIDEKIPNETPSFIYTNSLSMFTSQLLIVTLLESVKGDVAEAYNP